MPFYEYQCSACGQHQEELQKVSDRPLRKCPACGRSTLKRLVSAPVFRLKGAGWYETDFKKDGELQRNIAGEKQPATADSPPAEKPKDEKAKDEKPQNGKAKDDKSTGETTKDAKADTTPKPATLKKQKSAPSKARRRRPARR